MRQRVAGLKKKRDINDGGNGTVWSDFVFKSAEGTENSNSQKRTHRAL